MDFLKPKDFLVNSPTTLYCSAIDGEIDQLMASQRYTHTKSLGIGNLEAALTLQEYLHNHSEIDSIIFFGSCGAYPWSKISIGSFVSAIRTHNLEISANLGHSKQIQNGKSFIDFKNTKLIFPSVECNAPSTLTLLDIPAPFNEDWQKISVENLELFGVARVCERQNLSLSAHLAVTNIVGSTGSYQWQTNWRKLSMELQTSILNL